MGMAENSYLITWKTLLRLSKAKEHFPWSKPEQWIWVGFFYVVVVLVFLMGSFSSLFWVYDTEKFSLSQLKHVTRTILREDSQRHQF